MPAPPRPRVFLLTTDYPPDMGGLQTYSHRIARDLPGGLLVRVAAASDHPSLLLPKPSGGAVLEAHRGRDRLGALAWSTRRILALRLARGYDVLLHMQWSTAVASWLLRKAGIGAPYVILVHGAELLDPGRDGLNRLKASVLAGASAVVAGSRATADLYRSLGLPDARLQVIHYGNPMLVRERPASGNLDATGVPEAVRLLCMHRLVPRKGTALLLQALARLKDLSWTLKVVGRGEEEAELRRLARELGLDIRIAFEPPVGEPEKARLLDQNDVFILPSLPPEGNNHVEGLGLTLLEAQGRGVPVLSARTGGIPEAVDEGRTGLLFAAGDARDLEAKLRTLIGDAALRARLGAAGPAWVKERFDWGKSLQKLAEVLQAAAGVGKRRWQLVPASPRDIPN